MKRKISITIFLAALLAIIFATPAFARVGQIGFFGGITEGVRLPLTTEQMIADANTGGQSDANFRNMFYTEIIWLDGMPTEFEGLMNMTVNNARGRGANPNFGTRTVRYEILPSDIITADGVSLERDITFTVTWRREGNQVIETYTVARTGARIRWAETITTPDGTFELIPELSHFEVSIIRDITPGVTYYSGNISMRAVYAAADGETVIHYLTGKIYGYVSAWSATETHRLDGLVIMPTGEIHYSNVPSVAVSKELQYSLNEPTLISFFGNYREITTNQSGLNFVINTMPAEFYGRPTTGRATISSFNRFEQLIAPNLNHLRGHFAYQDIRRLFAMEVITGNPNHFVPNQAVSRAEFMTMLARAVKLPLDPAHLTPPPPPRGNRPVQIFQIFPDLWPDRPDYAYLRAINDAGIAQGRGDGHFHPDQIIYREEAYVLTLRVLGLSNLGLDPMPMLPYVDSYRISAWALNDINAATRIGLIAPDEDGMLHPQEYLTKAQAAALINRLIEYMRHELIRDYTENIINFMN
ncbi:MAG: S-layer homology domain-containing protein [Clostridiales bacterium]|nr:S-layer homology domain-containing protein [Clostridiales bacterium]